MNALGPAVTPKTHHHLIMHTSTQGGSYSSSNVRANEIHSSRGRSSMYTDIEEGSFHTNGNGTLGLCLDNTT